MATEKFHYTTPSGVKIVMPKFGQIPMGIMRKLRREDEANQMFGLLETLSETGRMAEDVLPALDELGQIDFADFMQAWQKDSETSFPES